MTEAEINEHPMVKTFETLLAGKLSIPERKRFTKRLAKLRLSLVDEQHTCIKLLFKGPLPPADWDPAD